MAVFSGHDCAYVPNSAVKACNLLVEQMPPVSTWGWQHCLGMLGKRTGCVVRGVTSEESSRVFENGREVALPLMLVVPPVSQYDTAYRFATPLTGSWHNFVNLMAPTVAIGDGAGFSGIVEIGEGTHTPTKQL